MTFLGAVAVFSVGCAVISHQAHHDDPPASDVLGGTAAQAADLPATVDDLFPEDPRDKYQFLPGVQIAADHIHKQTFQGNVMIHADTTREGVQNWPEQIQAQTAQILPIGTLKLTGRWTIKDNATNWISSWRDESVAYISPDGKVRVQGPARHVTPSVLAHGD